MKCPKCDYLGFDTGDRCRNCGYDFSLLPPPDPDLTLHPRDTVAAPDLPALPLFARTNLAEDEPLIKVAAAPRPPLAVRRTPETPRFRALSRPVHRSDAEPALQFFDDDDVVRATIPVALPPFARAVAAVATETSSVSRRVMAAAIDHTILSAIDVAVVYFTLRIAALTMSDWRLLPPVPMVGFLAILKLAYFCAFTSAGGQTIGKMAARIQVVADDDAVLDPSRAVRRVLAGALSVLTLGVGFIPALFDADRRALHDRVAGTRVVARPS